MRLRLHEALLVFAALLIIAVLAWGTQAQTVPASAIERSLTSLGQPSADARGLVAWTQSGRIEKSQLPLLSRVVRQYESLTTQFCPKRWAIDPNEYGVFCGKWGGNVALMAALAPGNIALHRVVDRAQVPWFFWSYAKDQDIALLQWFRNERTWGHSYGY